MFGKNKCKITWPIFHLFIREEESETRKEIFNLENQLPKKLNKIIKIDTNFQTQNNKQNIIYNKNKDFDLSKYCCKEYFTVLQHLELMKNNKYFCIEYEMNRGCSTKNCTPPENIKEFFSPSINFNE